ncbi:WhiB family transcriptional regulator [Actinokineospora sp. PR83]|uniref:WhiB family transcriptional regulator n=1 Tax=Actinokineospora sp. PR83 TaxID=2884908 RepID=UPI0027DF722D|nr:WhiB family transcriptional regulator [Actinokineospora sp. PR83]
MIKLNAGQAQLSGVMEPWAGLGDQLGVHVDRSFDRRQGLCARGVDPDLMFPAARRDSSILRARALCAACPVRVACLAAGQDEAFGIWGGETEWERQERRAAEVRENDLTEAA